MGTGAVLVRVTGAGSAALSGVVGTGAVLVRVGAEAAPVGALAGARGASTRLIVILRSVKKVRGPEKTIATAREIPKAFSTGSDEPTPPQA